MAYDKKQYVRVNWKNKPSTATPLDEVNLNNMDNFLNVVDNTLIQFEAQKLNIATANSMIASLTIDTDSGIITAKQLDGTTFTWNLNIEKIPVSFSLSEDGILTMITEDGTEWTCDIAELIKEYVFDDSETIAFTREISEEDGSIHIGAAVKEGSIKSEHLNPDYRADIQEYTNQAEQAANESLSFSKDAKRWAVGDEEYEGSEVDNSKYYKEQAEAAKIAAEQARDEAQAATGAVIATTETVGVVKPDGESIEIAEDGTIKAPLAQTDKAGIIKPDNQTIGVEEDGTIKLIAKAANLPITDMQGLVGEENQETTTQLLINAIAEKVANQLVTNDALTTQLANYVTKAMMSNIQANDQTKVPTSALVYGMNEDISVLNSNLNGIVSPQKSTDANNIPNGVSFFTYHSDTLNGPSAEKVFGGTNAGIALAYKYSDVYAVEMALAAGVPNRYAGIAARAKEASGWSKWIRLLTFANIQTGVVNFATTPGEVGTFAVTFPQAFSSAPKVFVNAKTSSPGDKFVNAGSITSTGFTVYANVNSASITVDWLAAAI